MTYENFGIVMCKVETAEEKHARIRAQKQAIRAKKRANTRYDKAANGERNTRGSSNSRSNGGNVDQVK